MSKVSWITIRVFVVAVAPEGTGEGYHRSIRRQFEPPPRRRLLHSRGGLENLRIYAVVDRSNAIGWYANDIDQLLTRPL